MSTAILVVDDSLTVRMDLAEALEKGGFAVRACATAEEARRALEEEPPGLVILDVLLPDADGVALLAEIKAARTGLPVILLSTEAEVRDRIRGLETGADDYVGKPYDRGYLLARAAELIGRGATEAAGEATLLLIDDSATYREELCRVLGAEYRVMTAATGEEGLAAAASVRPAAIIVDGVLPGIDGAGVIRRIRLDAALRHTPCLLLTGSEAEGAEIRALDAGADAFVRKTEEPAVVLARLHATMRSAASGREAPTQSLLARRRILAVDDSETYLQELGSSLRAEGYDVVLARSGEEALHLLGVQAVDCILLDLLMPGMSGKETCQRIKSAPVVRDTPLILLTAVEGTATMLDGLSAGADDYVAKSSDLEVLKARIRAQIRRKQFEDENRRIRERLLWSELQAVEARAARDIAEERSRHLEAIERKNRELEAYSYSVSHDLRAPLRSIDGFSEALLQDYGASLPDPARDCLGRVRGAARRMGELIEDLLELSRVGRADLHVERVDLSHLARSVAGELRQSAPEREVSFAIEEGLVAEADGRLVRILLENLLGNAWKFSSRSPAARIEVGREEPSGDSVFYVRDNGVGFDMGFAGKLFAPFRRLHQETEFPGTGIGLATVARIVDRHGGRVWAEAAVDRGATFFFTLSSPARSRRIASDR